MLIYLVKDLLKQKDEPTFVLLIQNRQKDETPNNFKKNR